MARGMVKYYDRQGSAITLEEWDRLNEMPRYRVIARTQEDGYLVSTVWLGLDHSFGGDIPVIFETMIFRVNPDGTPDYGDIYCDRYSTEESALDGHAIALLWLVDYIAEGRMKAE